MSTHRRWLQPRTAGMLAAAWLASLLSAGVSVAHAEEAAPPDAEQEAAALAGAGPCGQSARAALKACGLQASSDRLLAVGTCANVGNTGGRRQCLHEADASFRDDQALCDDQHAARQKLCQAIGQEAYDPRIDPQNFTDRIDNPYFPLKPGTIFVYRSPHGADIFEVTRKTKRIEGVTCVIVHDVGYMNGKIEEDTLDYFAQDRAGNVWYFGEDTAQYEDGVVVGVEGSWRSGVERAKPGIVMQAAPGIGAVYRQEFSLGTAEDAAEVKSLSERVRVPFGSFDRALRTKDFSPLEPDALEAKYYVRHVGQVLTVDLATGEREELVAIRRR